MTHTNRGRLTVLLNGPWRLYTSTLPANSEALGVISRGEGSANGTGALVHMIDSGLLVQVNAGAISSLDQRKAQAALDRAREEAQQ